MKKKCEYCKGEFEAVQKTQRFCKREHTHECEFCHDTFIVKRPAGYPRTCSRQCRSKLTIAEKMANNNEIRECELCGDEFTPFNKAHKFCNKKHMDNCEICGIEFEVQTRKDIARACSQSCGSVLTHTESSRQTRKENSMNKHGVEHPFQADEVKKKIRKALDESEHDTRFGRGNIERIIKDKYGVDNVSSLSEIKKKKINSYRARYGVDNPAAIHIQSYKDWKDFYDFTKKAKWDCSELAEYFNLGLESIRAKAYNTNAMNNIKGFYLYSNPELEIRLILNSLGLKEGIDFIPHYRKLITPLEVDFFLPDYKLAIEVSPTYTHNSRVGWGGRGKGKSRDYHINKFYSCEHKGVKLITVFDWHDLSIVIDIIKSHINYGGVNSKRYKYEDISTISRSQVIDFLGTQDSLSYNAEYEGTVIKSNDEVVGLSLWSENIVSKTATLKLYKTKPGFDIGKALSESIKHYISASSNINKFICVSDNSLSQYVEYEKLGFKLKCKNDEQLNYYEIKKEIHIKSQALISNKKDILKKSSLLPVYNCGSKVWVKEQ